MISRASLYPLGSKDGIPKTGEFVPANGTAGAKNWWGESPLKRAWRYRRFITGDATAEDMRDLFLIFLESGTAGELEAWILTSYDVVPGLCKHAGLEYKWSLRFARLIVRNNWPALQELLYGVPPDMRKATIHLAQSVFAKDPAKGKLLYARDGLAWLGWSAYNIGNLARAIGDIKGRPVQPPPWPCPKLQRLSLPPAIAIERRTRSA